MGTRVGFFVFAGLIIGAGLGIFLPFYASIEAGLGAFGGLVVALILDRRDRKAVENDDQDS